MKRVLVVGLLPKQADRVQAATAGLPLDLTFLESDARLTRNFGCPDRVLVTRFVDHKLSIALRTQGLRVEVLGAGGPTTVVRRLLELANA